MFTNFVNAVKRSVAQQRAINKLKNCWFFNPEIVGVLDDVKVVLSNDAVMANICAYAHEPNACVIIEQKIIFVNDAFREMPADVQDAILLHELGHIVNKHNERNTAKRGKAKAEQELLFEAEADLYSHLQGANMIAALELMVATYPTQEQLAKRLDILKTYIAQA